MNSSIRPAGWNTARAALAGLLALLVVAFPLRAAEPSDAAAAETPPRVERFDVLKTKTTEYRNVTVTARNPVEIHIRHDGGVQNVKLSELDDETLAALGFPRKIGAAESAESKANEAVKALMAKLPASLQQAAADDATAEGQPAPSAGPDPVALLLATMGPQVLIAVLAVAALLYLFSCYCLKLICEKAGAEPGLLVWLPVLQIFPMLRAAKMSAWWFLGFCLPGINLITQIVWSVKIAEARGKSIWTALCLILPVTNLFAFLYLAFSDGGKAGKEKGRDADGGLPMTKSRKIILGAPNPLHPAA